MDLAIKFGAGRYRQEQKLLSHCGEEIRRFGKKVYIIAGRNAWNAVKDQMIPTLDQALVEWVLSIYEGSCSYEAARTHAEQCLGSGCDEVIGVGGGRIMDFSKAVGEVSGCGVINIPTSISTCAAFTSMSIMYTTEGKWKDNWRFDHETDAVLVDLDVIAQCPGRFAAAGIMDAMAKWIEIRNGQSEVVPESSTPEFYTSYVMAEYTYHMLERYGIQAVCDINCNRVTEAVQYVTFMNIAVTGLLSNMTRSTRQSALAHTLYYGIRTFFNQETKAYIHGEIVAVGLLLQLGFNRQPEQKEKLREYMKAFHMPMNLKETGMDDSRENRKQLEDYLAASPFMEDTKENRSLISRELEEIAS